jgi:hypothetical protein
VPQFAIQVIKPRGKGRRKQLKYVAGAYGELCNGLDGATLQKRYNHAEHFVFDFLKDKFPTYKFTIVAVTLAIDKTFIND